MKGQNTTELRDEASGIAEIEKINQRDRDYAVDGIITSLFVGFLLGATFSTLASLFLSWFLKS